MPPRLLAATTCPMMATLPPSKSDNTTPARRQGFFGVRRGRPKLAINLALQGGGAHGAFTWGVLDRLADEPSLEFGWISATSAGAVNAAAFAAGLAEGGPAGAKAKLRDIWEAVHKAGVPDLLRLNPFLAGISRSGTMAQMAQLFSPYDFNPLGFDPLRRLLETHIDFALLRRVKGPELLIAATDVATGATRLFRRAEITVEAVLASACLPTLHHAVRIDNAAYWDGGFSANPDLVTLARESPIGDTLLVQLTPFVKPGVPTGAREIAAHVNHLTFNAPLIREIEMLQLIRQGRTRRFWARDPDRRVLDHRFHLIDASRYTANLATDSQGKPELQMLNYLHGAGIAETGKWLERHLRQIGRLETADLGQRLAHARSRAALPEPVAAAAEPASVTPGAAA